MKFNNPSKNFSKLIVVAGFVTLATIAHADDNKNHEMHDHSKMDHSSMNHEQMSAHHQSGAQMEKAGTMPTEPGQGAFATIQEIVSILTNDYATDWDKVDINALREHLIDMDEVALRANATTRVYDDKIVFIVTGTGRTLKAIQAMVPAHSMVLSRTTAWDIKSELTETGAIMTVTADKPAALKVVKALGFFGVMATGAHHQAHHLAMARGEAHIHAHN